MVRNYKTLFVDELHYITKYYESSRLNIFELVRTYHPIEFGAFLYLIESWQVQRGKKRSSSEMEGQENVTITEPSPENNPVTEILDTQLIDDFKRRPTLILKECFTPNLYTTFTDDNACKFIETDFECRDEFEGGYGDIDFRIPQENHQFKAFIDNRLTIIGVLYYLNRVRKRPIELTPLEVRNINLFGTKTYHIILAAVKDWILPPDLVHTNRNISNNYDVHIMKNISEQFLSFMKGEFINLNVNTFQTIPIKKAQRVYDINQIPNYNTINYFKQPSYNGLHVIINYNDTHTTKVYNIHGHQISKVPFKFNVKCTIECVLLGTNFQTNNKDVISDNSDSINVNETQRTYSSIAFNDYTERLESINRDELMSWRYMNVGLEYTACHIVILDCLRYKNKLLINMPYEQRLEYAKCIETQNSSIIESFGSERDIAQIYHQINKKKIYPVINGVIFRHKRGVLNNIQSTRKNTIYSLKFPLKTIYNTLSHTYDQLTNKEKKLKYHFQFYFNLNMIKLREIVIVYYHDDDYLYLCNFNRKYKQFVHLCQVSIKNISVPPFSYTKPFFVKKCGIKKFEPIKPKGYAILRLYYNDYNDRRTVVAVDWKKTLSIHDIPYKSFLETRYFEMYK